MFPFSQQIDSIERVNNDGDVNVTFFITKDGQRVPAPEAAENYQKLSKAQLGRLIVFDVSVTVLEILPLICGKCFLLLDRLQKWEIDLTCCCLKLVAWHDSSQV